MSHLKNLLDTALRFHHTPAHSLTKHIAEEQYFAAIRKMQGLPAIPKIVCLCGSTKFMSAFEKANYEETMMGNIVLTVGALPNSVHIGLSVGEKTKLDELHKRKIDLADEVFVLNVGGYTGESTRSEIAYAVKQSKPIRWLEDSDQVHQLALAL